MLGALIAVAVVAVACAVALLFAGMLARRRGIALAVAQEAVAKATGEAAEAEALREAATAAAEAAEAAESEAEALAISSIERAERAEEAAGRAREALDRARAAAALDPHAGGLWVLEALRLERRWFRGVAPGVDGSPFDGSTDPARAAVEILIEAAREEVGASFDLDWALVEAVPSAAALRLARLIEELLAEASIATDGGDVEVAPASGGLVVRLRTEPSFELSGDLAAALEVLGELRADEGAIVVGISWRDEADEADEDELGEEPEGASEAP